MQGRGFGQNSGKCGRARSSTTAPGEEKENTVLGCAERIESAQEQAMMLCKKIKLRVES